MPRKDHPQEPDPVEPASSAEPDRESLVRALRDLEAARGRVEQNAARVYDDTRRDLVVELLPVLDNLDRTLQAAGASGDAALLGGLRMVRAQLEGVLTRYGIERVDSAGQRFDPALHEAVAAVPVLDPAQVGRVLSQVEPGYRFAGRMLRAAKVSVGVAAPPPQPTARRAWGPR